MRETSRPDLMADFERLRLLDASVQAIVRDSLFLMIRLAEDPDLPAGARLTAAEHLLAVLANPHLPEDIAERIRASLAPHDPKDGRGV